MIVILAVLRSITFSALCIFGTVYHVGVVSKAIIIFQFARWTDLPRSQLFCMFAAISFYWSGLFKIAAQQSTT